MKLKQIILLTLIPVMHLQASSFKLLCQKDPTIQLARSLELQQLKNEDQLDRKKWNISDDEWKQITARDLTRRKRVSKIFAEGCFKSPKDYLAAALIFQHGNVPDHYYQTFIWARKAAKLSKGTPYELPAKNLSALAIDRYLISTGHKQLFGSQFQWVKQGTHQCYCMQPVEPSFSSDLRKKYSGRSIQEEYDSMEAISKTHCPRIVCNTKLSSTPKNSVLGVW